MQPFFPNLNHFFRARSVKPRKNLTCLSNANDIAILHTDRDSLPLNRGWFFIANLVDDFEDLGWDGRFLP